MPIRIWICRSITRTLAELYDDLLPYERLLGHGLNAVMVAHVRYPQVDPEVASLSPYWLRTALRRDLGMHGAIFTDDLSMKALASEGEMPERARRALAAGADMALICNDPVAADATLEALQGYTDPAGQSRLVALRRRRIAAASRCRVARVCRLAAGGGQPGQGAGETGPRAQLMIPPVAGARLVATTAEVEAAYQRLATAIQPHVAAGDCVLLGVLLGGALPLVRIWPACCDGDFRARYVPGWPLWRRDPWRYSAVDCPPQMDMRGQHVILVDDIFDEGITLEFVAAHCREQGARKLSTAVLVRKRHDRASGALAPDHVGLEVGDEYVFGCGMDYQGRWRHLPAIWGLPG